MNVHGSVQQSVGSASTLRWREHPREILPPILLVLAIILGGGGSPNAFTEVLLGLIFVSAALAWVWLPARGTRHPGRAAWMLIAVLISVPALQLVPLPPAIWQSLPGREPVTAALQLVGADDTWRPISIVPHLTIASLLSLLPPTILLYMTASTGLATRRVLLLAMIGMGIATVLLGTLQIASDGSGMRLYAQSHEGVIVGFQANRNATADVLLIAILAMAAYVPMRLQRSPADNRNRRYALLISGAFLALLVLGTVLTASRAGIALLVLALGFIGVRAVSLIDRGAIGKGGRVALAVGVAGLALAAGLLAWQNEAIGRVIRRFGFEGEFRPQLWEDTLYAIGQYWPVGYGSGGFTPAVLPAERLEVLDRTLPNRAHNDFLELVLEAGALGIVQLGAALAIVAFLIWRAFGKDTGLRDYALFTTAALVLIALHSVVDYPLRSMSLACLCAVAIGMLFPVAQTKVKP